MAKKQIVIDDEKCVGCGACANACHQGAIQMVNGKAKLVRADHCDGLGRCLPQCPVNAIQLVDAPEIPKPAVAAEVQPPKLKCGCPGTMSQSFKPASTLGCAGAGAKIPSALAQWPIQLQLVPENAPYWADADVLIAADCTAFSYGGFHPEFLSGKRLIIACPKLDDTDSYVEKLKTIFANNSIRSITVLYMEVPCCHGLVAIVKAALEASKKEIPVNYIELSLRGEVK